MKILILSSYTRKQKYKSDNCIRSEDLEPPARLESRIKELSGYSAPAGEMFTGPLHTQLRQGLKQIRKHDQYGENTLDLYFPWYDFRVDREKTPVSENDHIVPYHRVRAFLVGHLSDNRACLFCVWSSDAPSA